MKIEPIPTPTGLAHLQARLTQSERTLIAEAQRTVLHSGRAIVGHCAAVAGPEGAKFADEFCNLVLWSRMPPEAWPLSRLLAILARTTLSSNSAPSAPLPLQTLERLACDIRELVALRTLFESVTAESMRKGGIRHGGRTLKAG